MGNYISKVQTEKLLKYCDKLVIVPDGDGGGEKLVKSIKKNIDFRIPVFTVNMPESKDIADLPYEQVHDVMEDASKWAIS